MPPKEKMVAARGPTIALPIPNTATQHHDNDHDHHLPTRLSHYTLQTFSEADHSSTSMAIPGARIDHVPPALPPPRYNNDLDNGLDIAWNWQNEHLKGGESKLAPIKPGSSLLGNPTQSQLTWVDNTDVNVDSNLHHSQSSVRAVPAPSRSHFAAVTSIPSLTGTSPSPSGINQTLQGENPLAQQNHNKSTHAYDKHILLKIGKSNSPPEHRKSSSRERNRPLQKLSIQTKVPNLFLRPVPESAPASDPVTQCMTSPLSVISTTPRSTSREYSMDPRSPSSDFYSHPGTLDPDYFHGTGLPVSYTPLRREQRHSPEDSRSRSARDSYDSAVYAADPDYPEEEHSLSNLHIEEKPRTAARHGAKRLALSPSPELLHEHKDGIPSTRFQRVHGSQSAVPRQPYRAESLSSTASSTQYNSFASSNLSSFASSSMTSVSSTNTPVTREYSQQNFPSQTPRSGHGSAVAIQPLRRLSDNSTTTMSMQSPPTDTRTPLTRIGNHYICSCCPKKPKKFDSEEQLRTHENEKQYTCAYCNNRFKNKNEAERHQNSLHLRRQSWSCAAISTYQAAFHPSSFSNPRNLATDVCGFCGEEFDNHPTNWEERIDHLTNFHKFGECNASKKFFRADHFRQHLKHSHAGKSGKWTNILENSCQREEAPSESASLSPTASEHSQSGSSSRLQSSLMTPADIPMSGVQTIDEVYEES